MYERQGSIWIIKAASKPTRLDDCGALSCPSEGIGLRISSGRACISHEGDTQDVVPRRAQRVAKPGWLRRRCDPDYEMWREWHLNV